MKESRIKIDYEKGSPHSLRHLAGLIIHLKRHTSLARRLVRISDDLPSKELDTFARVHLIKAEALLEVLKQANYAPGTRLHFAYTVRGKERFISGTCETIIIQQEGSLKKTKAALAEGSNA